MGLFSNLASNPDALSMLAGANGLANFQPVPTTSVPISPVYGALSGLSAAAKSLPQTINQSQALSSAALNLQRQQALQPLIIDQIKGMTGGSTPYGMPSTGGNAAPTPASAPATPVLSAADQQFSTAYRLAMLSGDMGKASAVLQSWAEHNPALAGAIKRQQEMNTFQKTPQGTFVMPNSPSGTVPPSAPIASQPLPPVSPSAGLVNGQVPTQLQATGSNTLPSGQPDNAAAVYADPNVPAGSAPAGAQASTAPQNPLMMRDGKALIPEAKNLAFYKPNPTLEPAFPSLSNTTSGVQQIAKNQDAMQKGNTEFSTLANNFKNEDANISDLINTYHQIQAGTLTAQNPDLLNKFAAWGVLPKDGIHDLAGVQRAMNQHILDVISQMKDQNANVGGGAAQRLFSAEISTMLDEGANAHDQPEALFNILTKAKGMVDYGQDMLKGWNAIGGTGNRLAGGDSMLPDTYSQKFIDSHDPSDYIAAARKTIPPFKGMSNAKNSGVVTHIYKPGIGIVPVGGQ